MKNIEDILKQYQNSGIKFRVCSSEQSFYDSETKSQLSKPHVSNAFYLYFLVKGISQHQIDLTNHHLSEGDVAIVFPNQIHYHNKANATCDFFELFIEENKQFILNKHLAFLTNPLNKNLISLSKASIDSISFIFQKLISLQYGNKAPESLHLSYLNVLLEELNLAYFDIEKTNNLDFPTKDIEVLIAFKNFLFKNLSNQYSVEKIATEIGVSTNQLYKIVKQHTNKSPLEFIKCLIIDEAKRQLFHSDITIKELAYKLGYTDPAYFSRVFKEMTGQSAQIFRKDLSNS